MTQKKKLIEVIRLKDVPTRTVGSERTAGGASVIRERRKTEPYTMPVAHAGKAATND
jgi:hypothetical protein